MMKYFFPFYIFILVCAGVCAEEPAVLLVNHAGEAETAGPDILNTIAYTAEAMEAAFTSAGLRVQKRLANADLNGILPESAQGACAEAGVRWGLTVYTHFLDGRFSWRFGIYDAEEGVFRGEDAFAVYLYAGISSRNAVEQSAQAVAAHWRKSFQAQEFSGVFAVEAGQVFITSQEAVTVYYGNETDMLLGETEDGRLTAPLVIFEKGAPVYGTLTKKGFWTRTFAMPKGVTDTPFRLPALQKITRHTVGFLTEFRSAEQFGIDIAYRFHCIPDRIFLKFELLLWMNSSAPDQKSFIDPELRFGLGIYLLPKPDYPFRVLAGLGGSFYIESGDTAAYPPLEGGSTRFYLDPLWVGLEYHFAQVALTAELRFPGLFSQSGREALYFVAPGQDSWPVYGTIGVMLKW